MVPPRAPSFVPCHSTAVCAYGRMNRPSAARSHSSDQRAESDVFRNDECPRLRNPRPRRNFHHRAHRPRPRARAHLPQPFAQAHDRLLPRRLDERELLARVLRELDRLEPELDDRRRELLQLRPERRAQARRALPSRRAASSLAATSRRRRAGRPARVFETAARPVLDARAGARGGSRAPVAA